jgi:hypothetical protein
MVFQGQDAGSLCVVVDMVNMEELIATIILEEQEYDDLLVYCMIEGAADGSKKRIVEGYYCSFVGRRLMESEVKFREFLRFGNTFSI